MGANSMQFNEYRITANSSARDSSNDAMGITWTLLTLPACGPAFGVQAAI